MKMLGIIDQQETLAFCDAGECINEKDLRNLFLYLLHIFVCVKQEGKREKGYFDVKVE